MSPGKIKSKPSGNVDITPRDYKLLEFLAIWGILTRLLIQILLDWKCVSDVNRRLAKLVKVGYILRRRCHSIDAPAIYTLGAKAVNLLDNKLNIDVKTLNRRRYRYRNLGDSMLAHELAISEFACLFSNALKNIPTANLIKLIPADELVSRCNVTNIAGDQALRPDAYFSYRFGNLSFNLFLEVDLGNEPLRRIAKKIELYRAFKASSLLKEHFGASTFRILIITVSDKRATNIASILARYIDIKIFIANLKCPNKNLLDALIWLRPGSSESCSLHSQTELEGRKE